MHKNIGTFIIAAALIGIVFGCYFPTLSSNLKIFSDIYIRLITLAVGPIIFCTLFEGIAKQKSIKALGLISVYSIIYFEIITTFALLIGLIAVNVFKPGANIITGHINLVQNVNMHQHNLSLTNYIINIFPNSFLGAFVKNNIMQILFFSTIFACAARNIKHETTEINNFIKQTKYIFFKILDYIIYTAPLAAFGAIAYTVGKFGANVIQNFAELVCIVYSTALFFIIFILGLVCRLYGFSLFKLIKYLKDEILISLATSSSEAVLPQLIKKLEQYGCSPGVTGFVVPAGYSLNLDGTAIYLSIATLFIAQAYGIELSMAQQAFIMLILMINSKGAAAVSGGGFITLSATLFAINILPTEGLGLLIAIDRLISPARSVTNIIGNSVATIVMSKINQKANN